MRFRELGTERLLDRPRDSRAEIHLAEPVTVPLEEPNRPEAETENLVAIPRLEESPQGFGVKAVRHDDQLLDRERQAENVKEERSGQHGQPILGVVPETVVLRELLERLQELLRLEGGIRLSKRPLHLLHEVSEPNPILLVLGVSTVSRLVEREARRLVRRGQRGQGFEVERGGLLGHFVPPLSSSRRSMAFSGRAAPGCVSATASRTFHRGSSARNVPAGVREGRPGRRSGVALPGCRHERSGENEHS